MKKEPWRWIVFGLSIVYIVFMWVRKDIGKALTSAPPEQLLPMALTSVAVTVVKVIAIAGGILLLKWLLSKLKK